MQASAFPSSVIRAPRADAACTCEHWAHCAHGCHAVSCDPTESVCHLDYRPDEGGLTAWGCPDCTPGERAPHLLGCELIGWSVPMPANAGRHTAEHAGH
jgi:hypothetical protein